MQAEPFVRAADTWVFSPSQVIHRHKRNLQVALIVGWIALSAFDSYPPIKVALSENNGTAWQRAGAVLSSTGVAFDWFSLTAYGGIAYIFSTTRQQTEAEQIVFKNRIPISLRVIQVALSIFLGASTRLAAITEAIKFNSNKEFGIATAAISFVGESGLPALSVWAASDYIIKRVQRTANRKDKDLHRFEAVRIYIIGIAQFALNKHIRSPLDERAIKLCRICHTQVSANASAIIRIQTLLTELQDIYASSEPQQQDCCRIVLYQIPRKFVQLTALSSCIGLFILDALLAKTAVEICAGGEGWVIAAMILAWLPLSPLAAKMIYRSSGQIYDVVFDSACGKRDSKSFSDEFYPKISKVLKVVLFLCSILQYDEQIALAKLYTDADSIQEKLLSYSNIVACCFLITESFYASLEEIIHEHSLSSRSSEDVRQAIQLKKSIERLITLIKEIRVHDLAKILDAIEDDELKKHILGKIMSIEELKRQANQVVDEEQPLLINGR